MPSASVATVTGRIVNGPMSPPNPLPTSYDLLVQRIERLEQTMAATLAILKQRKGGKT